jgi:hypothetical protein
MTAITKYECNLCRRPLDNETKPSTQYPDGWSLRWEGPGATRPEHGATLDTDKWNTAPVHLCQVCVMAVGLFYEVVKRDGLLQPVHKPLGMYDFPPRVPQPNA